MMVARFTEARARDAIAEDVPRRVQRIRQVVNRFQAQITASGGDPAEMFLRQETDLMREGLYTNPLFKRTVG